MLTNTHLAIQNPAWNGYYIQVLHLDTEDERFQVCSKSGVSVNVEWQTVVGATACVELIAGGYWKGV